ncbi:flavodoxin [Halobacillus sp. BBL2006]|uniref:flavodoxin n=1 Tax=Halobacillus sp. BBL2006 TaxID=1543706 RepID=UPI0005437230|nr:flavodoxin [Halobacillus sp. BBL2006]KHE67681.1 flavodoxin [Halobacillus sp. BBL2006]
MAKILICFASMSGNTEDLADLIQTYLEEDGHTVFMEEMDEIDPSYFHEYDGSIIGSYTWNDGDLPYEAEDFYDGLEDEDLKGVPVCVFGSGDTAYPKFCEAVNIFEKGLMNRGATLMQEGLKIEMDPDGEEDVVNCRRFVLNVSKYLTEVNI